MGLSRHVEKTESRLAGGLECIERGSGVGGKDGEVEGSGSC